MVRQGVVKILSAAFAQFDAGILILVDISPPAKLDGSLQFTVAQSIAHQGATKGEICTAGIGVVLKGTMVTNSNTRNMKRATRGLQYYTMQ
jgi:hypothetical protein